MRDITEIRIQNERAAAEREINARDPMGKRASEFEGPAAGKGSGPGDGVQAFSKGELFPGVIMTVDRADGTRVYNACYKAVWTLCSSYREAADWIMARKQSPIIGDAIGA
jgi:hypothetical protein